MDLALNNVEWLICQKTKPNQTKTILLMDLSLIMRDKKKSLKSSNWKFENMNTYDSNEKFINWYNYSIWWP